MKCDICGTESDFDAGFIKERKTFRTSHRTLCPACWIHRRHKFEGWSQLAIVAGGIIGCILLWVDPQSFPGWFLTVFFLVHLFLILTIIPHELGHAIVARLLGWRVFQVVIGIGKPFFRWRGFGINFTFNRLPVGGITQMTPVDLRWFRVKRFLAVLAGPAINFVMAAAVFFIWQGIRAWPPDFPGALTMSWIS